MAPAPAPGAPVFSFRNGFRCVPEDGVTVEELLEAVGEQVGLESIHSASRMDKAIVVFLNSESLVNELTLSGIWVRECHVVLTPLSAQATKVTISNVPTFLPDDAIRRELTRFGKIASPFRKIPLGCKNPGLKHVLSFRRQVYMVLNSPDRSLEISFRVRHEETSCMLYASTESLRCFECGDIGHKRFSCPRKHVSDELHPSTSPNNVNTEQHKEAKEQEAPEQPDGAAEEVKLQNEVSENGGKSVCDEQPGVRVTAAENTETEAEITEECGDVSENKETEAEITEECGDVSENKETEAEVTECGDVSENTETEAEITEECVSQESVEMCVPTEVVQAGCAEEGLVDDLDAMSQPTDGTLDEEQWSDNAESAVGKDFYTVKEINSFLDEAKGKAGVEIRHFFPDLEKFVFSAKRAQNVSNYDELSQQKRFRLKKHITAAKQVGEGSKKRKSSKEGKRKTKRMASSCSVSLNRRKL